MPTLSEILKEHELKKLSEAQSAMPKYNDDHNQRFNEIYEIIKHNRISGVLCRLDDKDNLFQIVYNGEIYKPFLKNSKLYVQSKIFTYHVNDFIAKIKQEQAALFEQAGSDAGYSK